MGEGLQGLVAGKDNVRRQLQMDDPSSPSNALSTLVKWWSDWRAQQAAEPDITNPPVGFSAPGGGLQGLMGSLRGAAKPVKTFRGMEDRPIEGVESFHFPGLEFSSESKQAAQVYASGPRGHVQELTFSPERVLDLRSRPSVEGSKAVQDEISTALSTPIPNSRAMADVLRDAGYDAVAIREHIMGRHPAATTWIRVKDEAQ